MLTVHNYVSQCLGIIIFIVFWLALDWVRDNIVTQLLFITHSNFNHVIVFNVFSFRLRSSRNVLQAIDNENLLRNHYSIMFVDLLPNIDGYDFDSCSEV